MERKNKKIVAGMMAGFYVLSTQTLVQYGLLVGNGGITAKHSPGLQAFGDSDKNVVGISGENVVGISGENVVGISGENVGILDENNVYDGCQYELDDRTHKAALKLCPMWINTGKTHIIIPEYVQKGGIKYPVVRIDDDAFTCCDCLTTVTLSKFIESVGSRAFYACYELRKIIILGNLKSIMENALDLCGNLREIYMRTDAVECWKTLQKMVPLDKLYVVDNIDAELLIHEKSVYSLNDDTGEAILIKFLDRDAYKATIPEHVRGKDGRRYRVTGISNGAFGNCYYLLFIDIPEGVTRLGDKACQNCINLIEITLPRSLDIGRLGEDVFEGCSRNLIIKIPKGAPCKDWLIKMGLGAQIVEVKNVYADFEKLGTLNIMGLGDQIFKCSDFASKEENEDKAPNNKYKDGKKFIKYHEDKKGDTYEMPDLKGFWWF